MYESTIGRMRGSKMRLEGYAGAISYTERPRRASSQGGHSLRFILRRSHWLLYGNGLEDGMSGSGETENSLL